MILRDACDQLLHRLGYAEPAYLSGLLTGTARAVDRARRHQSVSVVWTGPESGASSSRLTAAAMAGYLFLVIWGPEFVSMATAAPGLGLTPWILAALAVGIGIRWRLWRRRRTALMRSVPAVYEHWTGILRDQVLRPFIVERRNDEVRNPRLFDTSIGEKSPPRLLEGSEPRRLVLTDAMTRVSATARNVHSGSVGVHLFSRLCEIVPHGPADRSAIVAETRGHLDQLRYLRTYTTSWSASLTPKSILTLAGGYAKQRAEQPVTLPELVDSFRGYSTRVASWQRAAHGGEGRVVIGIDEIDKIRDGDRAEAFRNDIKAIFGVPGCLYLVSLSEDAMADFARRTPSIRSAFDSALDRLVTCLKDRNYAVIDDLAAARHAMRINAGLAHRLLEEYRLQNGMRQARGST